MKFMNKIGAVAVSVALVLGCSPAAAVAAEQMAPVEKKTVTWTSGQDKPSFAQTITVGGVEYKLTGEPVVKETKQVETVSAEYTDWKECWPSDLNATIASFGETYHYDKDGYEGDIARTGLTYAAIEAEETSELNATRTWNGLTTNDVTQIPATVEEETEWGHTVTLTRAGLEWTVTSVDERGLPKTYSAFAIYRGLDTRTVIDHYRVEATYAGDAKSKEPVTTYEATLTYQGPVPAPAEKPLEFDWTLVAGIAGAAAAAAAGAIIVPVWRRSNMAKFYHVSSEGGKLTKTLVGSSKVTANGTRLLVDAGSVKLDVAGITDYCTMELPSKYAGKGYSVKLTKGGETVYEGAGDPCIKVFSF